MPCCLRTLRPLALAAVWLAAACLSTPAWATAEFLVNTTTADNQESPRVATLTDGGFVVVWTDLSASPPGTRQEDVRARVFNADGSPRGNDFMVPQNTSGQQSAASVTALQGGGFVVAWTDTSASSTATDVWARVFSATGAPAGNDFVVNTTLAADQYGPAVATLSNGNFVVTWTDSSAGAADLEARMQIFSPAGVAQGAELPVNASTADNQSAPRVTALTTGGYVVAWNHGTGPAVNAQRFDANGGALGAEFQVSPAAPQQWNAAVAALPAGGFVVVWEDSNAGADLWSQRYDGSGNAVGTATRINTTTASVQRDATVAATSDGYVVTWLDFSQSAGDTDGLAVRGQRFASDGTRMGGEFLINTTTAGSQANPSVTRLGSGFVAAWHGNGVGDDYGVFARLFTSATVTVALAPASDTGTPGDGVTSTVRPTFTGTAPPGSTITVRDGATVLGTTVADEAGLWRFTPASNLPPGAHALTVTAEDPVSHATDTATLALTVSAAPPVTPPVTPPVVTPVPTLGQWSLWLLSLLAAVPGLRRLSGKSGRSA